MSDLEKIKDFRSFKYELSDYYKDRRYKYDIKKICLFNFFMGCYLISGIIIPFFFTWGKISIIEFIFLQCYYSFMIFLFGLPCGVISDYLGRKNCLFLAGLTSAIGALVYGISPNLILFFIGETLFAFSTSIMSGSSEAFTFELLKKYGKQKEFTKVIGRMNGYFLLAIAISGPIGALIAYFISLQIVMILMFIPYIIGTLIVLSIKDSNNINKEKSSKILKTLKSGLTTLKNNKTLRILTFDMLIIDILVIFLVISYQYYLFKDLKVSIIFLGLLDSLINIFQMLCLNIISNKENQVKNKKRFLFINTLIPGIGYILLGFIFFTPLIIFLILIIIGFGLSRSILFLNGINKEITKENRATILSTINMIKMLLRTICFLFLGIFLIWSINLAFILIGLSIILIALTSRVKKQHL